MFVFSAKRVRAHDFRDNLSGRHLIEVYPFASAIQSAPRKGLASWPPGGSSNYVRDYVGIPTRRAAVEECSRKCLCGCVTAQEFTDRCALKMFSPSTSEVLFSSFFFFTAPSPSSLVLVLVLRIFPRALLRHGRFIGFLLNEFLIERVVVPR